MTLLSHPSQMNSQIHLEQLSLLRECLATYGALGTVQLRDWDFLSIDGVFTVQVFLDRGLRHPSQGRMEGISLDECAALHRFLLDHNAFSRFSDDLSFEVGSAGINPRLRDSLDFERVAGCWVSVETWERNENRRKYVMVLEKMEVVDGHSVACLREGEFLFRVPVSSVRRAEALFDRGVGDRLSVSRRKQGKVS